GGLALFGQQGDELFLLGNHCVDFGGFAVEEYSDGSLLGRRRNNDRHALQVSKFHGLAEPPAHRIENFIQVIGSNQVRKERRFNSPWLKRQIGRSNDAALFYLS